MGFSINSATNYNSFNGNGINDKKRQVITNNQKNSGNNELSNEDNAKVDKLQKIDAKVKAHEMAHMSAGGGYVRGGISLEYTTGPDGKRYAVAGEVSIDTSPEKDPQKTIQKMRTVIGAALAPADPSPQDRSVASQARSAMMEAQKELAKEIQEKISENKEKLYKKDGTINNKSNQKNIGNILDLMA